MHRSGEVRRHLYCPERITEEPTAAPGWKLSQYMRGNAPGSSKVERGMSACAGRLYRIVPVKDAKRDGESVMLIFGIGVLSPSEAEWNRA